MSGNLTPQGSEDHVALTSTGRVSVLPVEYAVWFLVPCRWLRVRARGAVTSEIWRHVHSKLLEFLVSKENDTNGMSCFFGQSKIFF